MEEKEARRPSRIMNWLGSKLKRLFLDNDSTSSNKQDINNDLELLQGLDTILQMFNPRKLDIGIMSVEPELVEETFELSPDFKGNDAVWKLGLNELCEVPDGLANTNPPSTPKPPSDILIRPRVNTILLLSIAEAKTRLEKEAQKQQPELEKPKGEHHDDDNDTPQPYELVHLSFTQRITMPYMIKKEYRLLQGIADYYLWYREDTKNLETNLIVVRARKLKDVKCWTVLTYMSMIHQARKMAGKDAVIYGIATDSYEWAFMRIDNKSQYTRRYLHWTLGQQKEIVSLLNKIVVYAAMASSKAARTSSLGERSVSKMTRCRVTDILCEMDESDDSNDSDDSDDSDESDDW